jgi:hypothetical protein
MTIFKQTHFWLISAFYFPITLLAVPVSTPIFTQANYARYDKAEANFSIGATYSNNNDPAVVAADAEITKPSGAIVHFPCFYYVPCQFSAQSSSFWIATENTGAASWLLRFAPMDIGTYTVRIRVTENGSTVSYSNAATFTVSAGHQKGFIRLDGTNNQFMRFDNGSPYYPVGTNVAWNDQRLSQYYTDFFNNIPTGGMTWTRYWLTDFARQALEWKSGHWSAWYNGLGQYSQKAAALLDHVLAICAAKGCYMQLVLQHHGQFSNSVNPEWADNPYNSANGGPLSNASQFFSSATAKAQTKKQYRYIIARWAYSPHILAWELFNEVNYTEGVAADIEAWHEEMGEYIKSLDIHKHLITTSTHEANSLLQLMDNNANLDQLQFHYYGTNLETSVLSAAQTLDALVSKPLLSGEFGYPNNNYLNDNAGDHLRKTLWVNQFNRIPTTFWYWQEYIIPKNLYGVFTPLSNFLATVDITNETNALGGALSFQHNPGSSATLILATQNANFSAANNPDPWTGSIDASGNCTNINGLGRYLHGSAQGFNREVSFSANFMATGSATINLRGSSGWGANSLEIYLDGVWQSSYTIANNAAGTYTLSNIAAGTHTIKFRSAGQDWLEVATYAFTNVSQGVGNCLAYGYVGSQKAYGFVYDKTYGEWAATADNTVGASLRLQMTAGNYLTEFWNPQTGATTSGGIVATNSGGELILNLPNFNKDIAFKISYSSPIPLELLSFTGKAEGIFNRLNWQTAHETNVQSFELNRSLDGKNHWQTIATFSPKGQGANRQVYHFDDDYAAFAKTEFDNTNCYYQLAINDLDGTRRYSKTILIARAASTETKIKAYPTQATDHINLAIENPKAIRQIQILDLAGRVWLTENLSNTVHRTPLGGEGERFRTFSVAHLPQGIYFLVAKTQEQVLTQKFIKA